MEYICDSYDIHIVYPHDSHMVPIWNIYNEHCTDVYHLVLPCGSIYHSTFNVENQHIGCWLRYVMLAVNWLFTEWRTIHVIAYKLFSCSSQAGQSHYTKMLLYMTQSYFFYRHYINISRLWIKVRLLVWMQYIYIYIGDYWNIISSKCYSYRTYYD